MNKVLVGILCFAVCSAATAQRYAEPVTIDLHVSAIDLLRQIEGPRAQVSLETPANQFLLAVVGSTPGANGTNFTSEVTLVNNRTVAQNVSVIFFPQLGKSCNGIVKSLQIAPQSFAYYADFVNQVFKQNDVGSAVVIAVDSAGNLDLNGNIDGTSRIWTPVANFRGTASQTFPAQTISYIAGNQAIYGLHTDANRFRSSIWVFNMPRNNTSLREFTFNFVGSNQNTGVGVLDVGPCQLGRFVIPADYAATSVLVIASDDDGGWFAVGSSVDNDSGDSWSILARPIH